MEGGVWGWTIKPALMIKLEEEEEKEKRRRRKRRMQNRKDLRWHGVEQLLDPRQLLIPWATARMSCGPWEL